MRFFLLATASTMVILSAIHPAYSTNDVSEGVDARISVEDRSDGSRTPEGPLTPSDAPPQTPDIEGAAAAAEHVAGSSLEGVAVAAEPVAGSSAVSHDGGGGGAAAAAEHVETLAPIRTLAQQRNQGMAQGIVDHIMNDPKNQPGYLASLRYSAHDYADNYDKVIKASNSALPPIRRAVLDHLEERAKGSKLGDQKDRAMSYIQAERHSLNISVAPIVPAREYVPNGDNLVGGVIGVAMSPHDVTNRSQEILDHLRRDLDPADINFYHAVSRAAADESPQVQQALVEKTAEILKTATSKAEDGREIGKLYSKGHNGDWHEADASESSKVFKIFKENKVAKIAAATGGSNNTAFMIEIARQKAAKELAKDSLNQARKTHDAVSEHAEHMSSVIGAMEAHLNENHDSQHIETLNAIKQAHEGIRKDLTEKNKNGHVMTVQDTHHALVSLNELDNHIENLPSDHAQGGHKDQLIEQHKNLKNAFQDHQTVMSNHDQLHSQALETQGFKLKKSNKKTSPQNPSSQDTVSSSPNVGEGGGGGGGSAVGETQDHTTPSSATVHDAHPSSADGHPATQTHESHHDAPVHVTTPHEAHVIPEHHSSGGHG